MKALLRCIDSISEWVGKIARWLIVALVLLISEEVFLRYVFDSPTMWNYETSLMIGGCLGLLAWTYVHKHHSNIRIDIIYCHLSPRTRAALDVLGTLLFFFPLIFSFEITSILWARDAWVTGEVSTETYWYPPLAPLRTIVVIAFTLLIMQGTAQFIRDFYFLIRNKAYD